MFWHFEAIALESKVEDIETQKSVKELKSALGRIIFVERIRETLFRLAKLFTGILCRLVNKL